VLDLLASADVIAAPSEAVNELEGTTVRYAGVSAVDRSLTALLAAGPDGRYVDLAGGRVVPPRLTAQLAGAAVPTGGFAAALSARRGSVFVVGGRDPSGALTRDARLLEPGGVSAAILLTGSDRPASVVAAVYSPGDEFLYVVDGDAPEAPHRTRLLRIDLVGGAVHVLGTWHASKAIDRYFLSRDLDGHVVLLASSSALEWFWGGTVRVSAGHVRLQARFSGHGLAMLPAMKTIAGTKVAAYHSFTQRVQPRLFPAKPQDDDSDDDELGCDDLFP
jgi:hypothetical protein